MLKLDQVENGARHAAQDKHEHDDEQDAALVDLLNLELEKFWVKKRSLVNSMASSYYFCVINAGLKFGLIQ